MSQIQSEGWFVAGSGDLDGQDGLTFFTEEGINGLQQDGFETARGLREFSVEQQLSVKFQFFTFQGVGSGQPYCGPLNLK